MLAPASTTDCRATRTGTRACCPRSTSGRGRCSPRTRKSTLGIAECCHGLSRSNESRRCGPRCNDHRRAHRRHSGRPATCRPRRRPRPGDSLAGDQRNAGRALRRRRLLPGAGQPGHGAATPPQKTPPKALGRWRDTSGKLIHIKMDDPGGKPGVGSGRTGQGRRDHRPAKPRNWPPAYSSPGTRPPPGRSASASRRCWRTPTNWPSYAMPRTRR